MENKIEHIKRTNIPENLKSKSELRAMRLRPIAPPVAYTYQQMGFLYYLYDIKDTKQMKKATENQLKALEAGRLKAITCIRCGEIQSYRGDLNKAKVCQSCIWKEEDEYRKKLYIKIVDSIRKNCRTWLDHPEKFVILDTETTGLYKNAEIVEIAIIDTAGKILFESLIKPTQPIPKESTYIHGITDEMVAAAPTWDKVWLQVSEILKDKTMLIFNAEFDERLIDQTCLKYGIKLLSRYEWGSSKIITKDVSHCIMEMYKEYAESDRWISLANACQYEGIEVTQEHRAKGDCLMVLELIKKLSG